jgi:ABC-type Na+ efflux pump permease subunit
MRKELRQLGRSRGALASATLLPIMLLVIAPMGQLYSLTRAGGAAGRLPTDLPLPGLADFSAPIVFFTHFLFPLFVTLGGVLVPSVAALYSVVAERERSTLELLMALPVTVADVLTAKVMAILLAAVLIVFPLYALDATVLLLLGIASVSYVLTLFALLLAALSYSVGVALIIGLLARDFRTANNINGLFVGPLMLGTVGILFSLPGDSRFFALIAMLVCSAVAAYLAAVRWLTFERYLG